MIPVKIAVMASGRGSNLKAILDAAKKGECPVQVEVVISDKADAPALAIARDAGVPIVEHINPKDFADRAAFDAACADVIEKAGCEWIALAGYMRILSSEFVQRFAGKI
ncbi:MAG: formyltransferase family protein, partial [Mariprofundaceae bacterium]